MKKKVDKKWLFKYILFFIGYTAFMFYLHKEQDMWIIWFGIGYLFFFILPVLDKIDCWLNKKAQPKNPYPVDEKFLKKLYPNGKPEKIDEPEEEIETQSSSSDDEESYGEREEREYWEREEEYVRYEASKRAWDSMMR